jgi:MoaA/NifB/PqqE/SkfB family radical SAM enzyme
LGGVLDVLEASTEILRGWLDMPYAIFRESDGHSFKLSETTFNLLKCCDGKTPILSCNQLVSFQERGWIEKCSQSDSITNDQRLVEYDVAHFRSVNIAITGRCNYNCRHCFMAKDDGANRGEFSLAQLEQLLDAFVRCGITRISLTGGEPFMHKDFDALLRAIAARGLILENITTNGSLITDETLALMDSLAQKPLMRVSFDGVGWHDWMRGVSNAESTALDAIRRLKAADFPVMAQMCVHMGNISTILKTTELMATLGVDTLRIMRTGESPRWIERMDNSALSFEAYYDMALELMAWYVQTEFQMDLIVWSFVHYYAKKGRFHCLPVRCPTGDCDPQAPVALTVS